MPLWKVIRIFSSFLTFSGFWSKYEVHFILYVVPDNQPFHVYSAKQPIWYGFSNYWRPLIFTYQNISDKTRHPGHEGLGIAKLVCLTIRDKYRVLSELWQDWKPTAKLVIPKNYFKVIKLAQIKCRKFKVLMRYVFQSPLMTWITRVTAHRRLTTLRPVSSTFQKNDEVQKEENRGL